MYNEEVLEAAREAQVQLMIENNVSKLPLWFGVPAKDIITGPQWVKRVEEQLLMEGKLNKAKWQRFPPQPYDTKAK